MLAARTAAPSPMPLKRAFAATTMGTARSVGSRRPRHSGSHPAQLAYDARKAALGR